MSHTTLKNYEINTMQRMGFCVFCGKKISNFDEAFQHYYKNSDKKKEDSKCHDHQKP